MNKKQSLRGVADKLWRMCCVKAHGQDCEVCGNVGVQVHHFFPKGNFGYLRYDLKNGIILCKGCHFKLHHTFDPMINEIIIKKKGRKWYNNLKKKAQEKHYSYQTVKWYEEQIKKLEDYLKLR